MDFLFNRLRQGPLKKWTEQLHIVYFVNVLGTQKIASSNLKKYIVEDTNFFRLQ